MPPRPVRFLLLALALALALASPWQSTAAADPPARNVILMISDGIGFNGWRASDFHDGEAGRRPYQTQRPDGTRPLLLGQSHWALNVVDADGRPLQRGAGPTTAAGAVEQGYDPATRWLALENAFRNDFAPVGTAYASYTDSAAAGTALHTGVKTANGSVNLDWTGRVRLRTIARIAMDDGRAAGVVTSVQASHATPASAIAHNASRDNYAEIFQEMVASGLSVIMGAGHPHYDDDGRRVRPRADDASAFAYVGGRAMGRRIIADRGVHGLAFIDERAQFEALAAGDLAVDRVLGIARVRNTLQAGRTAQPPADTPSGMARVEGVPDLATMSLGALRVLSRDTDGFFAMIEGGAVDWMGHANDLPRYIEEQADFNRAVAAVIAWVETHSSWDETLLIVTSDHETGGLWGDGTWTNAEGGAVAGSRQPEAIALARFDPAQDRFNGFRAVQDRGPGQWPGHQWASGNHTNDLVPLWALGAGSGLFAEYARTDLEAARLWGGPPYGWDGAYVDNTAVFHVMRRVLAADEAR